jgi:hypothetical protein
MLKHSILCCLVACDLGPRVEDIQTDARPNSDAPVTTHIVPPDVVVPGISTNLELVNQIRANDGLSDNALMMNNNVIVRSTGKSAGATVRFWNFGPAAIADGFAVVASMYVLGTQDGETFTPLPNHPPLIDSICGDPRYSAIRRVENVPVTATYAGEQLTTLEALAEALERGLVGEPVADETWVNLPVVVPGTMLEVGGETPTIAAKEVFARGYRVEVFELGTSLGRQPFRNKFVPVGQASGLQTGVPTGDPPTLSTAIDPQPVFQFAIPTMEPGMTFSYSPLAADVTVRLANGVAPAAITNDVELFRRSGSGAINAFVTTTVASFTIGTNVNNLQLQFAEGSP